MAATLTHRSPIAGHWYPGSASELRQLLDSSRKISIERTGLYVRPGGLGFIVPHAAPAYSGVVAWSVYRHVQAAGFKRIVLLGFSHRYLSEGIAVPLVSSVETPLGNVPVDQKTASEIAQNAPFRTVSAEFCDHSVEIQLPFLQTVCHDLRIVPLYVGDLNGEERRKAAEVLRGLMDGQTVLIASSDLTHYGEAFHYQPFPVDESTQNSLRKLDLQVLSAACSLQPDLFMQRIKRTGATFCGTAPIQLLLETLRGLPGEIFQETLDYETSGELTHDFEHSVSYGGIGYFPQSSFELTQEAANELFDRARFTLDEYRRSGNVVFKGAPDHPELLQRCRAFVTLFSECRVRGCIGRFEEPLVLADGVPQLAIEASEDGRFGHISPDEHLDIEIHILTPPRRIRDPQQFRVGQEGAYLKAGRHGGLLLAGVAERYKLTQRRFLEELARKACLPDSIYNTDNYELFVFRDQCFQEIPDIEKEPLE